MKCSELDILPHDSYVQLWPVLMPYISKMVNMSLSTGVFPDCFKNSYVKPLIKSQTLDGNSLSSYRQVSNLTLISKIIESAVSNQLQTHFEANNLLHKNQPAHRPGHSVETAILSVYSNISLELDKGYSVFLVLLDLSAAFDTISHSRLFAVLKSSFGVCGTALEWIKSYLTNRSFQVVINSAKSAKADLDVGVPQGSVLGPILFNCIMSMLPSLLERVGVSSHIYADDTQFWVSFKGTDELTARSRIEEAFRVISTFMYSNSLKLNANKTVYSIHPFQQNI